MLNIPTILDDKMTSPTCPAEPPDCKPVQREPECQPPKPEPVCKEEGSHKPDWKDGHKADWKGDQKADWREDHKADWKEDHKPGKWDGKNEQKGDNHDKWEARGKEQEHKGDGDKYAQKPEYREGKDKYEHNDKDKNGEYPDKHADKGPDCQEPDPCKVDCFEDCSELQAALTALPPAALVDHAIGQLDSSGPAELATFDSTEMYDSAGVA